MASPSSDEQHAPLTSCLQEAVKGPKKQLYRMRAHSNPLNDASFPVPLGPDAFDWCAWRRQPLQQPACHAFSSAARHPSSLYGTPATC